MIFPELLYQLSQRDAQVSWLEPAPRRIDVAGAALFLNADFAVPDDRILMLTSCLARSIGNGADLVDTLTIGMLPPGLVTTVLLAAGTFSGTSDKVLQAILQVIVPSGWLLRAHSDYNAAISVHNLQFSFTGVLLPAGNFSRV